MPEEEKDEYWFCIIGPCKRSELPFGADQPPRRAALKAIQDMIGRWNDMCWSGWGLSKEQVSKMLKQVYKHYE